MEGKTGYKKGLWTEEEDRILMEYVRVHGKGRWNHVAKMTGLKRCGKSCRLRWINYLSPSIKHGDFSQEEEDLIIRLHNLLGNRWSLIAGRVPGRTDNQVKNHWNTHLSKKLGVKKGRAKKVGSTRTRSAKLPESASIPSNMDMEPPLEDNVKARKDQIVAENGSESRFGCFEGDVLDPMTEEGCESLFWFSNLSAPSLAELLDHYSPDFVWPGL
ncbi:hypothetical protein NMG60_11004431 [Bertholletia excelsa]